MSDLPRRIRIHEEGPREGFQIESASIATADKIAFIEALSTTGVPQIDCVSYVDPRRVPGMADAEAVARGIHRKPGVRYTGLWLNVRGLERALALPLDLIGAIRVTASETFSMRNTGMNVEQTFAEQRRWLALYREHGIAVEWGYVMTAFGCNFEGEVPVAQVLRMVEGIFSAAAEAGDDIARQIWGEIADWLGTALASIAWLLNPDAFVIGGGVAQAGDLIFAPLKRKVQSMLSTVVWERLQIVPARFSNEAGIIGNAALAADAV